MTREVFLALTAYRRRTLLDLLVKSQGTLPIEALHLALLATGHRYVERHRAASISLSIAFVRTSLRQNPKQCRHRVAGGKFTTGLRKNESFTPWVWRN